jgi:hypothetical protein
MVLETLFNQPLLHHQQPESCLFVQALFNYSNSL